MTGTSNFQLEDLLSDSPDPGGAFYPSDPIPGDSREANRAYAMAEANRRGLDPQFVNRLFSIESGYNRRAFNKQSKAAGISQMIPATQRRFGLADPYNAKDSIDKGLDYLELLRDRFGGDRRRMAAGYFSGEGSAEKALANPKGNPKTAAYVRNVAGDTSNSGFNLENLLADAPQTPQNAPAQATTTKPFQLEDLLATPTSASQQPLQTPNVDTRDTMAGAAKLAGQESEFAPLELTDLRRPDDTEKLSSELPADRPTPTADELTKRRRQVESSLDLGYKTLSIRTWSATTEAFPQEWSEPPRVDHPDNFFGKFNRYSIPTKLPAEVRARRAEKSQGLLKDFDQMGVFDRQIDQILALPF
jgi:hypothetical protein